jgi:murein L,D-transpeptidase YafK
MARGSSPGRRCNGQPPIPMPKIANFLKAGMLVSVLALAACTDESYKDLNAKADKQLSAKILAEMKAKGMVRTSSVMARIFKEEGKVEIWKQKSNGRFDIVASYDICKWSGQLGPKFIEGDRQAPEGFYTVRPGQMNPNSKFHLAFNIGYPNAYDRAHGRTGSNLMVHGACSSSGCYSMTDEQMEQIYAFGRDAFKGGQTEFQIQAFPFRMTAANMARYRNDPNYPFWKNLKEGYDHFEITKVPPKVDVCEKRYVFNAVPEGGAEISPTGPCPAFTQPESLKSAYQSYQSTYNAALASASASGNGAPPRSSIGGINEAKMVREWTQKRARGEKVTMEPPDMVADGSIVQTTSRMGRIDSPAGRKMAALEAAAEAKKKAEAEKIAAKERAKREAEEAKAAQLAAAEAAKNPPPPIVEESAPMATGAATGEKPGFLKRVGGRIGKLFGQ